ncbi:TRBP2 protein, partial [Urocynchramus pylzowi]|nr:TRBP2 protein [Urocynchramus pylzowi]
SLEQMVAASPGKTPISLLQEYGTRLGRTPGYDLLKAEGQAHQPNFTFRVTLGDISCTGGTLGTLGPPPAGPGHPIPPVPSGTSPVPLGPQSVPRVPSETPVSPWTLLGPQSVPRVPSGAGHVPGVALSPGWPCPTGGRVPRVAVSLQELVVQKGWRLPEYTVTQESGPAHRKEFTMTCRVERFVEIGQG